MYDGVVVYGTGYYYQPWIGRSFYPRPWTYGFAARYNCYNNHWGFDFAIGFSGGRGWIGTHPGLFVRSGGNWFGLGGFRPVYRHDLPHETMAQRELALNVANRDGYQRSVYDHRTDVRRETTARPGLSAPLDRRVTDDVYTDRNGQVYRRTIDGWDQRQQNAWKPAEPSRPVGNGLRPRGAPAPAGPPRANVNELNQQYRARVGGNERARSDVAPPPRQEAPREAAPRQEAPREAPSGGGGRGGGGGGGGGGGRGAGGGRGR